MKHPGEGPAVRWGGAERSPDLSAAALVTAGVLAVAYVVWVLGMGGGDAPAPGRFEISLLSFALVGGLGLALAVRASRLEELPAGPRQGWRLLSLALAANWVGIVMYAVTDDALAPLPFQTFANLIFLLFYGLAFLALPYFAADPRTGTGRLTLLLDAAMVLVPGGMVIWRLMVEPVSLTYADNPWGALYSLTLPLCDLVMLAGLATLLVQRRQTVSERPLRLLMLGMVMYIVGDIIFARLALTSEYWSGTLPNAFWMMAVWLFGLSADVQRRVLARHDQVAEPAADGGRGINLLPSLSVAAGYGLLLLSAARYGDLSWTVTMLAVVILSACLMARQILTIRENERLLAERTRRQNDAHFSTLVQHSQDVIAILRTDTTISYISPSVERLLGHELAALKGASMESFFLPLDLPAARALLHDALAQPGVPITADLRLVHADGSLRDCELIVTNLLDDASVHGVVVTCHDVTERRAFERELTEMALNDRLTGLPNRTLLLDRVTRAMARAHGKAGMVAALLVDLDNFKLINDSLGHQTGDELLIVVADRLRECLRAEDTLARMGGDELGILIEDAGSEAAAVAAAERILHVLRAPFYVGKHSLYTSASIGIALSGPGVDQAASLLRNADLALYQAKAQGKARWSVFDPHLDEAVRERLELETALRSAVERGELWVAYQPIVDLNTGTICEVEALLRWRHPTLGDIPPARFIPVAEETGLIAEIGNWVLREACQQAIRWQVASQERAPLVVAVNLSGRQLRDPGLVELVAGILAETGLDGSMLKLELTESVVMESAETTIETFRRLRQLGVKLAIDDFGTGYSSLAYLKKFPINVLKIDRSFVDGIGRDGRDAAIIQGIIALACSLGLTVTAEGVETAEQAMCLKRFGCDQAQGYFYAMPLSVEQIEPLLAVSCPLQAGGGAEKGNIVSFPERMSVKLPRAT
ncbi:MAG: putative bifunctional diguanylate cyclase/phosphodiesterase [Chloroflexota bacterium]